MITFESIGYSGHSYVVIDSAISRDIHCTGYYDLEIKKSNPYNIPYLGREEQKTNKNPIFISIGDNSLRKKVAVKMEKFPFISIMDDTANVSQYAKISENLVYAGKYAIVNSLAQIDCGVIINTAAIIEHEVKVGEFSHIGPNAVVCGGCKIGKNVFIGAGAIIKQNISIGDNAIIGAGSTVINNLKKDSIYVGNPAKILRKI